MEHRLVKVRKIIAKADLDAILISSLPNITYLTNYSGFSKDEREAYLLITKNKQCVITDGRYSHAVKRLLPNFELLERSQDTPVKKILIDFVKTHGIKKIGFEENDITVAEFKKLHDLHHFTFVSIANAIATLRVIKTTDEIATIERACQLGDKAFSHVLKKIKAGVSEKELAFEIELFIKRHGADLSFPTIVAFGKNAAVPHHQTSLQPLATSRQLILIDMGVKINNYCSDMTRTVFFGKPTREQKKMYQTVLTAQQKAIEYLGARRHSGESADDSRIAKRSWTSLQTESSVRGQDDGIKASDVDKAAREYIISQGYPSIPHSMGHGTGIEVHEAPHLSPSSKGILKPGMVFSIEPGIYLPDVGGVRIEDLVVLEETGPRLLTKSPKKLLEI